MKDMASLHSPARVPYAKLLDEAQGKPANDGPVEVSQAADNGSNPAFQQEQ